MRLPRGCWSRRVAATLALLVLPIAGVIVATCAVIAASAADLYVDPSVSTPTEEVFTLAVCRECGTGAMGIDCEITFDPAIVELQQITAGAWVTDPGFPYFFYDFTFPGCASIRFSVAFLGQLVSGDQGQVAVCRFKALSPGVSPLVFTLADVRDEANQRLGPGHSEGDKIVIDFAVPDEPETLGRIKALYR